MFSGCGGFSLGAHAAGMKTVLAVDIDQTLSSSFGINFPEGKMHLGDISNLTDSKLNRLIPEGVDAIIGGAPCQAFSEIGANDPSDPRRKLVSQFFRVVASVDPAFFVFENVRGLMFEKNVGELHTGLKGLPSHWKILGPVIVDASDFGAPTRRKRVIVFGFNTRKVSVPKLEALINPVAERVTVEDAISDLQGSAPATPGEAGFSRWNYKAVPTLSTYALRMRDPSGYFTGHMKTQHSESTLGRFAKLRPGEVDAIGRYPRLEWHGLCPTLRAGTGSDKGSYQAVRPVHPDEDRVITPREAARLQGFPDRFIFHPTVWHSCRMIGNSVSPIMAEVLLKRAVVFSGAGRASSIAAE
ncbi:DNA-cytosine methyltransferase [Mesorhizobium sp. L2C066B000]|nr:DNA-cytosine methyltransferase [Mesorhizobium sp. L2C066B000]